MRTRGAWAAVVLAAFWFCGAWCAAQIEVAGELFVELDARDASAGQATWVNTGSLGDFVRFGAPAAETVGGVSAVTFNKVAADQDAYQCAEVAPAGIVGPDPTFSVEVWAYNPQVADEETLVAWGRRGGPDGSNMSFNYGAHGVFGAVGHWGAPDLGWRAGGGAPVAGQWHHLAYTYDGAVQRVYADGELWNERTLTSPKLNIHSGTKITIAAQILAIGDPADPNFGLPDFGGHKGALSIARVRVHDGVLSGGQVLGNYVAEVGDFPAPPEFVEYPASDVAFAGSDLPYTAKVVVIGIPAPSLEVLEPSGATISEDGVLSYTLPDPAPVSFVVGVRASNDGGDATASWTVTVSTLPPLGSLVVGGELFVELDAADETAGSSAWANTGTLDDFTVIGEPAVVEIAGARGVEFNRTALPAFDGYIQSEPGGAPAGLIGLDPTFTVEAWVFNRQIPDEETIVSWGKRGGPCGSNMSFNYGTNAAYGAVGHWCGQDIGWGTVPAAGQWRHLAYSYDGAVQRVFADGVETNTKYLGPNQINVWGADGARPNPKILLMAQNVNVGDNDVGPGDLGLRGVMTLGRLRIHDEALVLAEVRHNYLGERPEFPFIPPSFADVPSDDLVLTGAASYARAVSVRSAGTPSVEVLEPAGAEIVLSAPGVYTLSYTLPDPEPEAFTVALRATDEYGAGEAAWVVTVVRPADLAMAPVHRYSFAADASDSIGGAHGVLVNQSGAAA